MATGPRKSPKRRPPADFDVEDFLRPTDSDLRSALNSLLGSAEGIGSPVVGEAGSPGTPPKTRLGPQSAPGEIKSVPGSNLIPGSDLDPGGDLKIESAVGFAVSYTGGVNLGPGANLSPADQPPSSAPSPHHNIIPGINLNPVSTEKRESRSKGLLGTLGGQEDAGLPGVKLRPDPILIPASRLGGLSKLRPESDFPAPAKRVFAVRRAMSASDGHSRAEQLVYEAMWKAGSPLDEGSRILTIGFLTLGRLAGLSESNARINLRSLVRKLAVEQYSGYVCEQSTGYTWRVFAPDWIMKRREEQGLVWYSKRTLAVVFVDPETQDPILK